MKRSVGRDQIRLYLADIGITNEITVDQDISLALHGNKVDLSPTIDMTYDLQGEVFNVSYR